MKKFNKFCTKQSFSFDFAEGNLRIEKCVIPQLLHGYTFPERRTLYDNGEIFEFECEEGFALQGHVINICLNGELALEMPTCHSKSNLKICPDKKLNSDFQASQLQGRMYQR